jgi:tRNA G46 methylase TrmB
MNSIRLDKLNYTVKKQEAQNIEVTKFDANKLTDTFLE